MSTEGPQVRETIVAANDFRVAGALYKVVDADGDFSAAGGATAIGLALSQPNSGQHLAIGISGVFKGYAGAAISIGVGLQVAASGFLVTVVSGSNAAVGRALQAANSGDLFRCHLNFAQRASVN